MARPQSIPDEQILDAVREVFVEQGYHANSTELAARAKVSEGTLFRRFGTKEKLFQAAMGIPSEIEWFDLTESLIGEGELRDNVKSIAKAMTSFLMIVMPRMNALIHSGFSLKSMLEGTGEQDPPPVRGARILTKFFAAEQKLGRIGAGDPEIMARLIMGVVHDAVSSELHGFSVFFADSSELYLNQSLDIMLDGLCKGVE